MESFSGLETADFSGQEYEGLFLAAMDVGWDAQAFLKAKEREEAERMPFGTYTDPIMKSWFAEHASSGLPSFEEWGRLPSVDKKQVLLEWLAEKQLDTQPDLGEKLRELVAKELDLAPEEGLTLKLCSAAHSPADTLYGVDGFFRYADQTVTFDLTANADKFTSGVKYGKADEVIACAPEDENCLRQAARGIAHELRFKIERAEADRHQGARDPRLASQEERDKAIAARLEQLKKRKDKN
jgi:hypothetical protein